MREHIPAVVMALAAKLPQLGPLPPRPFAWQEYPGAWVIVFEDGRKIRFIKQAERPAQEERPAGLLGPGEDVASEPAALAKKGKKK